MSKTILDPDGKPLDVEQIKRLSGIKEKSQKTETLEERKRNLALKLATERTALAAERTYLAHERTWLAYLRLGAAVFICGLAFFPYNSAVASGLTAVGAWNLFYCIGRYRKLLTLKEEYLQERNLL